MNNETKINIRTGFVAGKVKVVVCTSCVTTYIYSLSSYSCEVK